MMPVFMNRRHWHAAFRLLGCGTLSLAITLGACPAGAQVESALAEALFREGKALMDQKNFADACPKLAESYRLEPKTGALLNLAVCQQSAGLHASAWASFSSVVNLARRDGQADREAFATEQMQLLEKVLTRLTLAGFPEGATVTLDGKPLDRAAIGLPLPIDPGAHRLVATAPGKTEWSKVIEAPATKADLSVTIPPLAEAPKVMPGPAPVLAPIREPSPERGYSTLTITGFAVGAAAAIAGGVTGGLSLAKTGEIQDTCKDTRCPASQSGAIDDATLLANVSNVAFAVAAVGVGVGIAGFWLGSDEPSAEQKASTTEVVVGPGAVGLRGRF